MTCHKRSQTSGSKECVVRLSHTGGPPLRGAAGGLRGRAGLGGWAISLRSGHIPDTAAPSMGGYPPGSPHPHLGAVVSRLSVSASRPSATLLALALAAALGACGIDKSTSGTPTPTHAEVQSESTTAPTTTAPRQTAAKPGEARGSAVTLAFGGDVHFEGVIRGRLTANPETTFGP